MALIIKKPKVDELARELGQATGETETTKAPSVRAELAAVRKCCSALPVLDPRDPSAILGYDHNGLPS